MRAADEDKESEVKSRGALELNSMAVFLLDILFYSSQRQGGENWGKNSWKSLDLVVIKPVGSYRLVLW